MQLLVDVGNARLKWARADATGPGASAAVSHGGDPLTALSRILSTLPEPPAEVVMVDVSGRMLDAQYPIPVRHVNASARHAGVRNAYQDPARLGADRWAALIGAWSSLHHAACIIDCGTAFTADLLDGQGRHLGGAIAPGPHLQRQALYRGTAQIREGGLVEPGAMFGRDTATAVAAGTRLAAAGFAATVVTEARRVLGADMAVVLTGGDAVLVRPHLDQPFTEMPDLVLQGAWAWAVQR